MADTVKRNMFRATVILFCSALLFWPGYSGAGERGGDVFEKLMTGNKRYVADSLAQMKTGEDRREELTSGQHPYATIITCSDSRVPPELIFNAGLGELFVIRVAGNVLDDIAIGSIEYGVEHLHTSLLIILGHTHCGAVTAAVQLDTKPEGNIGEILQQILPAVKKARKEGGTEKEIISRAIEYNVENVEEMLLDKSTVVYELVEEGKLTIINAIYYMSTGEVKVLEQ